MKISVLGKQSFPALLVCSAALSIASAEASPVVWTAPSLHRVGMTNAAERNKG